jgi:glucosamine-6-phosphate deaminase
VPTKAITMGIGTIFKAREIILMAWSAKKAPIIRKAVEGEMSGEVPATFLQLSDHVEFVWTKAPPPASPALIRPGW